MRTDKGKVRLVVVLDSVRQPDWVGRILKTLRDSEVADVSAIAVASPDRTSATTRWFEQSLRLFERTARVQTDLRAAHPSVPLAQLSQFEAHGSPSRTTPRQHPPGVDLALVLRPLVVDTTRLRECVPVISVEGWHPVDDCRCVEFSIVLRDVRSQPRVLSTSRVSSHPFSVAKTGESVAAHVGPILTRDLRRLRLEALLPNGALPPDGASSDIHHPAVKPRPLSRYRRGRWLIRQAQVAAADRLARSFRRKQWCIGLSAVGDTTDARLFDQPQAYTIWRPPPDRSWADPFPVQTEGRSYVFFEDLSHVSRVGRISVAEVSSVSLGRPHPVVTSDNHLSYPFTFHWNDTWFMMPQTDGVLGAHVYRATAFPYTWELQEHVLPDIPIVDATVEQIDGIWWLFATSSPGGTRAWDSLSLFYGRSPLGPWTPHPHNPVKVDARSARPAGRLFFQGGHWYRPAQDCSHRYGYGLVFNRIDALSEGQYVETPVRRWRPDPATGWLAHHTFNVAGSMSVVDFQSGGLRGWLKRLPTTTPLADHLPR